jgi:hypothetical protein
VAIVWREGNRATIEYSDSTKSQVVAARQVVEDMAAEDGLVGVPGIPGTLRWERAT